jgi:hypothetical protein
VPPSLRSVRCAQDADTPPPSHQFAKNIILNDLQAFRVQASSFFAQRPTGLPRRGGKKITSIRKNAGDAYYYRIDGECLSIGNYGNVLRAHSQDWLCYKVLAATAEYARGF